MNIINKIGRRKTAVARVYLRPGKGEIIINNVDASKYFSVDTLWYTINLPFVLTNTTAKYDVKANIDGGGIKGQAEALSLAISRALVEIDSEHRPVLKLNGLLKRDPRMVERKKYGQKKARKKFQYSKR